MLTCLCVAFGVVLVVILVSRVRDHFGHLGTNGWTELSVSFCHQADFKDTNHQEFRQNLTLIFVQEY